MVNDQVIQNTSLQSICLGACVEPNNSLSTQLKEESEGKDKVIRQLTAQLKAVQEETAEKGDLVASLKKDLQTTHARNLNHESVSPLQWNICMCNGVIENLNLDMIFALTNIRVTFLKNSTIRY